MRFDPEDYAFIARYDSKRMMASVKALGSAAVMRLIGVAVSLVIVVVIWSSGGTMKPSNWFVVTLDAVIVCAVFLVVTAVVAIIEKLRAAKAGVGEHAVLLCVLLIAAGVLLVPVAMLVNVLRGYQILLRAFVDTLAGLPGLDSVRPFFTGVTVAYYALLVLLILAGLAVVAGVAMVIVWLRTPRSLGWMPRRVVRVGLIAPPILLLVSGVGLLLVSAWLVPKVQQGLDNSGQTTNAALPGTAIFDDYMTWVLLAFMMITAVTLVNAASRVTTGALLLARMPAGNALRVDPLGVVVDDAKMGPQRVTWAAIGQIAGRERGAMPGPELVIGRAQQAAWSVPFMFLDVLPGTIDSAVRAHAQDNRVLDLSALDKMF